MRSYQDDGQHYAGQIGSENTPGEWLAALLDCTREWVRVLKPSGSMWINLGDKYVSAGGSTKSAPSPAQESGSWGTGVKAFGEASTRQRITEGAPISGGVRNKSLLGLPWRYALACIDDLGLILRAEVIAHKVNSLPESVTDRVRRTHEQWFHLVKQPRYYAAVDEIREAYLPTTQAAYARRGDGGWSIAAERSVHTSVDNNRSANPLGKLPGSVWTIASEPLTPAPAHLELPEHFAAFPSTFPRRLILAWSPPGICTACREGRRPVADVRFDSQGRTTNGPQSLARRFESPGRAVRTVRQTTITGYACACPTPDALTTPAVVLDPFGGTGTVALVASVLGRVGISVDLSHSYSRRARWRVNDAGEQAKAMRVAKPEPQLDGQLTFDDGG